MKLLMSFFIFLGFFIISCDSPKSAEQETQSTSINSNQEPGKNKREAKEVDSMSDEGIKEKTYSQVEIMPRFPGCEDEGLDLKELVVCANNRLSGYVYNRLRYPKEAMQSNIEGTVVARFVVRPDGLIDDISVHNDLGYGTGEHVIRIILSMNRMNERWIPGQHLGKPVRVRLALPIEFRMQKYD